MKNYNQMTIAQLEALQLKLSAERDGLKEQLRLIQAAMDEKAAQAAAEKKLAGMNEAERRALAQLLRPDGVESGEAFGVVGE